MRNHKHLLSIGVLAIALAVDSTGCGGRSDDADSGSETSADTGDGSVGTSASSMDPSSDEGDVDPTSAGDTDGPCGEGDACRTAEDCEPGHLCVDCSCCDPQSGDLACGDRPPPGGTRCEDEPGTMFLCFSPYVCCGSKELCYDPMRDPDFCTD
jgi:hypothetical protein